MVDFVWIEVVALPLDPNEPEMTPEILLLGAMGHPNYAKMGEIPMGLPDKIIADGPFYETDDPKLWWRKWYSWEHVKEYWHQEGRRDNGFVLRNTGYPQMADEHEAIYGPGLFTQINYTLSDIEESGIEGRTSEEKGDLLEILNSYRRDLVGCMDIRKEDLEELMADLDDKVLDLENDAKPQRTTPEELELEGSIPEPLDDGPAGSQAVVEEEELSIEDLVKEEEILNDEVVEEEILSDDFDVDEELGLDAK